MDQPVKSDAFDALKRSPVSTSVTPRVLVDQNRLAHLKFWELNLVWIEVAALAHVLSNANDKLPRDKPPQA